MNTPQLPNERRRFLRGLGGAVLGLPLFEAWRPRGARAATPPTAVFVVNMNGVQQAGFGSEPERFWPRALGPLTRTGLAAESDRATSVLAPHAERLLMVRGLRLPFGVNGCDHSGSGNQLLTAARVSSDPSANRSLAMGESIDNYLGRRLGREPLALYAGPKAGYINDHISHRGPKSLRIAENNPWRAYTRLVGMGGSNANPELLKRLATRRASVNDFVRAELNDLLGRPDLSVEDRQRLDAHLTTIREVEVKLATALAPAEVTRLQSADGRHRSNELRLEVEKMQMDLIAFALAAGHTRIAFLQLGDGTDAMTYTVNGTRLPRFHLISHRASNDTAVGDGSMPNAVNHHHQIDRIILGQLRYLLDKLAAQRGPDGDLLETGYALWANQVATGSHNRHNVPFIVAGRAGGFLKTGQYWSANGTTSASASGTVPHNRMLNLLINAAGVRRADGGLVDDFGDPSLPKGALDALVARR
jgi:hypothetical protein